MGEKGEGEERRGEERAPQCGCGWRPGTWAGERAGNGPRAMGLLLGQGCWFWSGRGAVSAAGSGTEQGHTAGRSAKGVLPRPLRLDTELGSFTTLPQSAQAEDLVESHTFVYLEE